MNSKIKAIKSLLQKLTKDVELEDLKNSPDSLDDLLSDLTESEPESVEEEELDEMPEEMPMEKPKGLSVSMIEVIGKNKKPEMKREEKQVKKGKK